MFLENTTCRFDNPAFALRWEFLVRQPGRSSIVAMGEGTPGLMGEFCGLVLKGISALRAVKKEKDGEVMEFGDPRKSA